MVVPMVAGKVVPMASKLAALMALNRKYILKLIFEYNVVKNNLARWLA